MSELSPVGRVIRSALTYAREQRGLSSDRALAEQLGIHPVTLWRWTQGEVGNKGIDELILIVSQAAREGRIENAPTE
jgi:transcriptional regulator with XRE-family HTH domain